MNTSSWNSEKFIEELAVCRDRMMLGGHNAYSTIRSMRVGEYNNTIDICTEGQYYTEKGKRVVMKDDRAMREGSTFYSEKFSVGNVAAKHETVLEVNNIDCLEEGVRLKAMGHNPVILNMANRHTPGGGVRNGAGAQEESIFRRTNLFRSLYQFIPYAKEYGLEQRKEQYPMDPNWGGIYTPKATLFRENEEEGYRLMETPVSLSFVTVAGINRPDLEDDTHMTDKMAEGTKNKMRTILRIGIANGHDAIVLGAIGCGAFCNPPEHVARLFHEMIDEEEFRGKYARISFAIIDDHNAHRAHNPEGNLKPFEREFGRK